MKLNGLIYFFCTFALIFTVNSNILAGEKILNEHCPGKSKKKIALVVSTFNNPFFVTMKEAAQKKANKLGYELIVLDSQNNSAKELANIEDLIVREVQIIMINPTDSDAVSNAVKKANAAGIPIITLDRMANHGEVLTHISSDNIQGGRMAGDFIANTLGDGISIIQLEGIIGTSAARERGEGFKKSVLAHKFNLLASQSAAFNRANGMNVMQNLLVTYPEVQAVFAQNDDMALGALQALKIAGKKKDVIVVGFDGSDDGVKAVKSGKMAATIAQRPELIGSIGVAIADKFIKCENVQSKIQVELQLVTE